jgi:hypothetical protein
MAGCNVLRSVGSDVSGFKLVTTVEFENTLHSDHSDEAIFFLLTITSPELSEPLYLVNNNASVLSRGRVYEPFPFEVVLPPEDGGKPKALKLNTYNLSPEFMDLVRQTNEPPLVKFEIVSTRDMDQVEKVIDFMQVGAAEYDAVTVSFTLVSSQFGARKTLQAMYSQNEFPGLFFALQ